LRLLRSFTLRVNTSGCCAAGQTTQNDGLPHGKPWATAGFRINYPGIRQVLLP
jgi:hypothetical protein